MSYRKNILVVEDDEAILELVRYNLGKEGYQVECVTTGEEAVDSALAQRPDLMILDLMLPGLDGLEVCKILRADARTAQMPIVMLTARGEEADIVTGLELGADDYVTKPFSPRVLAARVKAVLRRREQQVPGDRSVVKVGDLIIHPGRHEVMAAGEQVELTHTEFMILHFLARRPGWVFTRYQIVDGVQGSDAIVTDRSVDVHIVALRKKLGDLADYIETVRGVGYRMKDV